MAPHPVTTPRVSSWTQTGGQNPKHASAGLTAGTGLPSAGIWTGEGPAGRQGLRWGPWGPAGPGRAGRCRCRRCRSGNEDERWSAGSLSSARWDQDVFYRSHLKNKKTNKWINYCETKEDEKKKTDLFSRIMTAVAFHSYNFIRCFLWFYALKLLSLTNLFVWLDVNVLFL